MRGSSFDIKVESTVSKRTRNIVDSIGKVVYYIAALWAHKRAISYKIGHLLHRCIVEKGSTIKEKPALHVFSSANS